VITASASNGTRSCWLCSPPGGGVWHLALPLCRWVDHRRRLCCIDLARNTLWTRLAAFVACSFLRRQLPVIRAHPGANFTKSLANSPWLFFLLCWATSGKRWWLVAGRRMVPCR